MMEWDNQLLLRKRKTCSSNIKEDMVVLSSDVEKGRC